MDHSKSFLRSSCGTPSRSAIACSGSSAATSGQVVGVLTDLPTCEELIDRVVTEAAAELRRATSYVV